MKNNKIHRVIVEDSKISTFTGFITYETIFEFFFNNYYSDMIAFHININECNLITTQIITVSKNETIYNCLLTLWNKKISVLPIVDDSDGNKLFGFFYLKDLVYFFANGENFSVIFFIKNFSLRTPSPISLLTYIAILMRNTPSVRRGLYYVKIATLTSRKLSRKCLCHQSGS
jgi:CBS domain-containing protein